MIFLPRPDKDEHGRRDDTLPLQSLASGVLQRGMASRGVEACRTGTRSSEASGTAGRGKDARGVAARGGKEARVESWSDELGLGGVSSSADILERLSLL